MDGSAPALRRQHLIDPEICIRCNTCEEICPTDAIAHDQRNYVVDPAICKDCRDCVPPCPTGAIDNWRVVARPWTLAEQFAFDRLPPDASPVEAGVPVPTPPDAAALQAAATAGAGGRLMPPWSAAHPYTNLYGAERPLAATVAGNLRLTEAGASAAIHHIVLDLGAVPFPLLEGQSVGVLPPGADEAGKPHAMRLYSVASPREGERAGHNNLALTVKRVTEDRDGRPVRGVCSNYLCDLKKGETVRLAGPYGTTFLMPNHPGARLVMVCTGTGAAPMRAMTERRRRKWARGEAQGETALTLFMGARTPGELPYFGPLLRLPAEFIDKQFAFSRDPARPRAYVQDVMRERRAKLAALLADDNAYFYLCGHKRMEEGVEAAFRDIAAGAGLDWAALKPRLREAGRYHVETY
jgi:benzoyl-CoA 2,3-epoxidase subunit A